MVKQVVEAQKESDKKFVEIGGKENEDGKGATGKGGTDAPQ